MLVEKLEELKQEQEAEAHMRKRAVVIEKARGQEAPTKTAEIRVRSIALRLEEEMKAVQRQGRVTKGSAQSAGVRYLRTRLPVPGPLVTSPLQSPRQSPLQSP